MSLQTFSKGALRVAKNYTKGYSHTQMKVREATCNDPWPPSGKQMYELAQMTYNPDDFVDIMEILDKRLNDKGKNWRHVFKSLTVLDYLLHTGSENVIIYSRDNLYIIKTLREFQYIDDEGRDEGANVRQKAKDISNLLMDDSRLREERRVRARMRERLSGRGRIYDMDDESDDYSPAPYHPPRIQSVRPRTDGNNDDELRRAIEESKRSLAHERANAEERDMQRAIKLSEEEEEKRKKALLEANATALFDERNQLPAPTGQTNPFPLVDASLPLQYAVTGVQPQYTAVQPQYTALQPQFTSYNPYQQQALQEAMQAEYMRQQAEWSQAQQQAALTQQAQQEELLRQQQLAQLQQQQPLVAQPTATIGSNNPFAPPVTSFSTPASAQGTQPSSSVTFNLEGTYANRQNAKSAPPGPLPQQSTGQPIRTDRENARLASLFANRTGDGIDTFGNTGELRFGYTPAGRLAAQRTGSQSHNPFAQSSPNSSERPFFDV